MSEIPDPSGTPTPDLPSPGVPMLPQSGVPAAALPASVGGATALPGASALETCTTCGGTLRASAGMTETDRPLASGRLYAIGRLEPQFPSLDVEKEFAQVAARVGDGLPDAALLREVLTDADNRYLARQMCWVFSAHGVEAFAVWPREEADVTRLVELLPANNAETETVLYVVVVGRMAPAPGWIDNPCVESGLPLVVPDQLYAFTLDQFTNQMAAALSDRDTDDGDGDAANATPKKTAAPAGGTARENTTRDTDQPTPRAQTAAVVREVFHRLTRRSGNRGIADEHRALNYLALRYPPAYEAAVQAYREGKPLTTVHAHHSHARDRRLVTVQFVFRHRRSEITERYECVVDVTGFPFLVSGLQPTYG